MKRGTVDHIKTKRLARALGVPLYGAVGILECLFHLAQKHAWSGDVGRLTDVEIAEALEFRKPEQLVEILVAEGWLERCECHRLRIHDWPDHADQTVQRNLAKAGRAFLPCYGNASNGPAPGEDGAGTVPPSLSVASTKARPEPTPTPASTTKAAAPYVPLERATCPDCQAVAVIREKGRYAEGRVPGWVCWKRAQGCGETFRALEPAILGQLPPQQRAAVERSVDRAASELPPSRRASLGAYTGPATRLSKAEADQVRAELEAAGQLAPQSAEAWRPTPGSTPDQVAKAFRRLPANVRAALEAKGKAPELRLVEPVAAAR